MKILSTYNRSLGHLPRRLVKLLLFVVLLTMIASCKKSYLDVVPDNVATLDNVFANRTEAEKYLFTCYSYLPQEGNPDKNPGFSGGDEAWTYWPMTQDYFFLDPYNIARGEQNKANPNMNYWDEFDGHNLWQGIRTCNIFLENIDKVVDLQPYVKLRWVAEAKFIKAYLHWYLFRMYGPIPILDKNPAITANPDEFKVFRQPADSVVNYISKLIDEATAGDANTGLPSVITSTTTELGRITKVAALAIKARVLVTAASPLFNGNNDFAGFKGGDGKLLFNPQYDAKKWTRAADACKVAIDAAAAAGRKLYYFSSTDVAVNDATKIEMNIRNAICEKWNNELIWGLTSEAAASTFWLQQYACPQIDPDNINLSLKGKLAPPLKMAELFYTKNGVPIEEDKTWNYTDRFKLRTVTDQDAGMQEGYQTVGLHFEREPRFYADMAFDGSTWFMHNGNYNIQSKSEQYTGKKQSRLYSITGYYTKKVVNWNLVFSKTNTTIESYPWPVMRLSDLYLLYAEALNETGNPAAALPYLNQIRARAGLKSVESSWVTYSTNPTKYTTVAGLRDIIRQERGIEMAFEGSRFWDLRRWKTAPQVLSAPIYGWDIVQSTYEDYNRRVLLFTPKFVAPRDYFWPIKETDLQVNPNLVQNPGW
jgi:hypothetical protein